VGYYFVFFYNRGYRILAEHKSDNAIVLLCEGDNSDAGRHKVDSYCKDIQDALEHSRVISSTIQALDSREIGHYQEPTAVITGPNFLEGQPSAEFYQTIHYATVRKRGAQDTKKLPSFIPVMQTDVPIFMWALHSAPSLHRSF